MTWIKASDPLALLAIQAGQVSNPSVQEGASGTSSLDVDQRSVDIGEPVPIIFARWRDDAGGVLVSPGATEARFENDTSNNVTAYYLLPLTEGRMDSIQVRDVFQRACRVGSFSQTYNRRAGTWTPGNFIVERSGFDKPEASYICGSIGAYPKITTFSFEVTIPNGFDQWRRQVHIFIRGGMWVQRLIDAVVGPSDNFADLIRWMLLNSGRVPESLVDTAALTSAAQFLEANQLRCNTWIQVAQNYGDFIAQWAPYFLLGESNEGGKKGLRPLLPVNNDGTLNTSAIAWEYIFTENEILPGTFEIEYTSLADRQPFVAQMTWRQELGDEAAIVRTAEVRFVNTAETGPYELHDLSQFCTSELHAVKAGAYILARRAYVTHTIRFSARPQAHNRILRIGSIIRVRLQRESPSSNPSEHDYLYCVERITNTLAGDVGYECSHFPIDSKGRSIVSLIVANATGNGYLFTSNVTGVGCDINSSSDTSTSDTSEEGEEEGGGTGSEEEGGGTGSGEEGGGTGSGEEGGGTGSEDFSEPDAETIEAGEEIIIDDLVFEDLIFEDIGSGSEVAGSGSEVDASGNEIDGSDTIDSIDDIAISGGGGLDGGGLDSSEDNPSDIKDATPLGTIQNPTVGSPVTPPSGVCTGGIVDRIVGNIGDEENAIRQINTGWNIPVSPPEALGGDDWNGKFIQFVVRCPTGEEQATTPATQIAFNPSVYGFWRYLAPNGNVSAWYSNASIPRLVVYDIPFITPTDVSLDWGSGTQICATSGVITGTVAELKRISVSSGSGLGNLFYWVAFGTTCTPDGAGSYEFSNDGATVAASWGGAQIS